MLKTTAKNNSADKNYKINKIFTKINFFFIPLTWLLSKLIK